MPFSCSTCSIQLLSDERVVQEGKIEADQEIENKKNTVVR